MEPFVRFVSCLTLILALGVAGPTAAQTTLFDNGLTEASDYRLANFAADFTLGFNSTLTSTVAWFRPFSFTATSAPGVAQVDWQILANGSDDRPGGVLQSGSGTATRGDLAPAVRGGTVDEVTYEYSLDFTSFDLTAGVYWLFLRAESEGSLMRWAGAPAQGDQTRDSYLFSSGSDWVGLGVEPGFEIRGTPATTGEVVPEPSSVVLLATGLIGIMAMIRRRSLGEVNR